MFYALKGDGSRLSELDFLTRLPDPLMFERMKDMTADQVHVHVREVASRIDYPAVGTLVVQWVEHAKDFYAVSIGYAPGLFVQFSEERELIWAPKRLLPPPGERSRSRSVINPLGWVTSPSGQLCRYRVEG